MPEVSFVVPAGRLPGYLATPDGGPAPGVVVLHEVFGLNDDMRRITDRFAAEGYVALAPDLYGWGATTRCLVSAFRAIMKREGRQYDDIRGARDYVAGQTGCSGKVGVIGFCMGGGFAIAAAPMEIFDASAPNYGEVPKDAEAVLAGSCPIVASYGGRDVMMKGRPQRLEKALVANDVEHDLKVYPEAGHSFWSHHDAGVSKLADKIFRANGFREQESEDAWQRVLSFFGAHLAA